MKTVGGLTETNQWTGFPPLSALSLSRRARIGQRGPTQTGLIIANNIPHVEFASACSGAARFWRCVACLTWGLINDLICVVTLEKDNPSRHANAVRH